jgi:hypothetical protein
MIHPLPEEFSEYLDGELPPERAGRLERHVTECGECAALFEELRRVLLRAQALDDRPPRHDLWPGVAAAIGTPSRGLRRVSLSLPALIAAGVLLMLGSVGATLLWQRERMSQAPIAAAPESPALVSQAVSPSELGYAGAVRGLELELERNRERLDTLTVRILEEKLALIDRAIGEAERALAGDPGDGYLAGHLTRTRLRKIDLLRRAAVLAHAES